MNLPELSASVQDGNLKKLPDAMLKDANYYESLNELARIKALKQDDIKDNLVHAMLKSAIKENIINLSTVLTKNINSSDLQLFGNMVENLYDKNSKKLSKGKIKQVLKSLSKDINIYFPVQQHRENVMTHDQDFWVIFHPQIFDKNTEYFITGFNKIGEARQFSSKHAPIENVLVICYSENQENYSTQRVVCADCDELPPGETQYPDQYVYYEGIRITDVKTSGVHDGWLDGDLELRITLEQMDIIIGGINLSPYTFIYSFTNHDAGYWDWGLFWTESNKTTQIFAYRKLSDRQSITINNIKYYNDTFRMVVVEEDVIPIVSDDNFGYFSFHMDNYNYGSPKLFPRDSEKIWVTLDRGMYPHIVY